MAIVPGLKTTGEKVTQKINFVDLFGVDLSSRKDLRLSIAQDMIDLMISRTREDHVSVDGESFEKYSDSYKKSDKFSEYGKSNSVDMTLTGDMLGSIDVIEDAEDYIVLGLADDQNGKAHGHMVGANNLPVRRFFGVNKADIENIKGAYASDFESIRAEKPTTAADIMKELDILNSDGGTSAAQQALGDLIGF
jgi:hypothetical protein